MLNALRILGNLLRGRTTLWQCYASVTWRTCEECLFQHGRIASSPTAFPRHDGCTCELERFSVRKLGPHREVGRRMERRARDELRRRELFGRGVELLATDTDAGLSVLDQAAAIDVYLHEIEPLGRNPVLADPALRGRMREVLLARWKSKFATERYERQPELARDQQERWGVERILEIFA